MCSRAFSFFSRLGLVLISVLALVACSGNSSIEDFVVSWMRPSNVVTEEKELSDHDKQQPIPPLKVREDPFPGLKAGDNGFNKSAVVWAQESRSNRDRLANLLVQRSNQSCRRFQDLMYARTAARKVGLKGAALVTATASAIIEDSTTSSILAGVAAAATGADSLIDAEIMQNQLITIVISEIESQREAKLQEITARLGSDDEKVFTADETVRAIADYHGLCSFTKAISKLGKQNPRTIPSRKTLEARKVALETELDGRIKKLSDATTAGASNDIKETYMEQIDRTKTQLGQIETMLALMN